MGIYQMEAEDYLLLLKLVDGIPIDASLIEDVFLSFFLFP